MNRRAVAGAVLGLAVSACRPSPPGSTEAPPERPRKVTACTPDTARVVDISTGHSPESGDAPHIAIDTEAGKLLVVSTNEANGDRASLFRCNLDGSACEHHDVSAGLPAESGTVPQILIDRRHKKLLVLTVNWAGYRYSLALVRCELDGTRCAGGDMPGGELVGNTKAYPRGFNAILDPVDERILVVNPSSWGVGVRLVGCRSDGTACTATDLELGEHHARGVANAVLDPHTRRLRFITAEAYGTPGAVAAVREKPAPAIVSCALSGSLCDWTDIHAGIPELNRSWSIAAVDPAARRALAAKGPLAGLFRCTQGEPGCATFDFSNSKPFEVDLASYPVVDEGCGKLFILTTSVFDELYHRPDLWSCALDASGCARHDLGWKGAVGALSNVVLDTVSRRLLFVVKDRTGADGAGQPRPLLFVVPLR